MKNICLIRHQLISSIITRRNEGGPEALLAAWESLAAQVKLIIGESGFDSLYARSIFIAQKHCPWYKVSLQCPPRLMESKMNLVGLSSAQNNEGNHLLLITFTDILASLIGERLVIKILYLAWGEHTSEIINKGFDNE